jgi:hypothetical protein
VHHGSLPADEVHISTERVDVLESGATNNEKTVRPTMLHERAAQTDSHEEQAQDENDTAHSQHGIHSRSNFFLTLSNHF